MFGPFLTGFLMFISIWGTIFMSILGGLYYNQSVGLFEDLPEEGDDWGHKNWTTRQGDLVNLYNQNAYNAWISAGAYAGIAILLSFRVCCLIKR